MARWSSTRTMWRFRNPGRRWRRTFWRRNTSAKPACRRGSKKVEEETIPSWLWRSVPDEKALAELPENERNIGEVSSQAGVRPARRYVDLLGLEGQIFRQRGRRAGVLRRAALHARHADGGAELAAMVQHRPALGLRHRRAEPGPSLCRFPDRQADEIEIGLRASAAACLLHPVDRRRPRQRGRHHGPVGARGAAVQVRLRHRHEFLKAARRAAKSSRAAASRPA